MKSSEYVIVISSILNIDVIDQARSERPRQPYRLPGKFYDVIYEMM